MAQGLDQAEPVTLYLYIFRNRDAFERNREASQPCAAAYVTDPGTFEQVEQSPYVVASQGPWAPGSRRPSARPWRRRPAPAAEARRPPAAERTRRTGRTDSAHHRTAHSATALHDPGSWAGTATDRTRPHTTAPGP